MDTSELILANKEVQSAPWIITSKLFPGLLSMIDYELECKMRFDETKYNSLSSIPKKEIISSVWSIIGF